MALAGPTFERIYHWDRGPAKPAGNELCEGADGNLYGTDRDGGANEVGCLYRLTKSGTLTVLSSFPYYNGAVATGSRPVGRLLLASDGRFYGTTTSGSANVGGMGTIFSFAPGGSPTFVAGLSGTPTYLYQGPNAGLVEGPDGFLYGSVMGSDLPSDPNLGSLFKVSRQGSLLPLVTFTGTAGAHPGQNPGALTVGPDGQLYGTTKQGGAANAGTVFRVASDGTCRTLVEFTGTAGAFPGSLPGALVLGADGCLYGVTGSGGVGTSSYGTIFRLTTEGQFTSLLTFTGKGTANRGQGPVGGLVKGPNQELYGVTGGGGNQGSGTAFKMSLSGQLTTLADFPVDHLSNPASRLLSASDGNFYGTVTSSERGGGGVFRMTPDGTLTTLAVFGGRGESRLGATPVGTLAAGDDGKLYGVTSAGGINNWGTVFRISPANDQFESIAEFVGPGPGYIGVRPQAGLVRGADGNFYGPLDTIGIVGTCIFRVTPQGVITRAHEFANTAVDGHLPQTALTLAQDGSLFGGTTAGGTKNRGTLFQLRPDGTFNPLVQFTGTSGSATGYYPAGPLLQASDGSFYGATQRGGILYGNFDIPVSRGTLFKLAADGTFTTLLKFTGNDTTNKGSAPLGGLVDGGDGFFYGTTWEGGSADWGTIYKVTPDGVLTTLASFTGGSGATKGAYPFGNLWRHTDGKFYGVTGQAGTVAPSRVFTFTSAGTVTTVQLLDSRGAAGGLIGGQDGNLYGLEQSGPGGAGGIYRLRFGPTPATLDADSVTDNTARLNATVNPNGEASTVTFEWGPSPALGSETAAQILPAGSAPVTVTASLGGITPSTATYYFRVKAVNATGTQDGEIRSFTAVGSLGQWKLLHLGDAAAPDDADPDRDGVATLAEYALCTVPERSDRPPRPEIFDYPDGRHLRIVIPRDFTRTEVTVEVQAADSFLGPWTTIATSTAGGPFTGPGYVSGDDPSPSRKLAVEIRDVVALGTTPSRFMRLRVTR